MAAIRSELVKYNLSDSCDDLRSKTLKFSLMVVLGMMLPIDRGVAGPVGGQVVLGAAEINQSQPDATTVMQSSDRAVINWDSFGLTESESLVFQQPSNTSITVNRDLSGQLSQIDGALEANGQIFILNPAGIHFGQNASVNVGGLIASDLDITESFSITDQFALEDSNVSTGGITNEGVLRATTGGVALIGQQIINSGEVRTRAGDVQLISASEVSVLIDEEGALGYELTEPVRNMLPGSSFLIENTFDGVVVSIDGGDIVYSTRYVEDLLTGSDSVSQQGADNVLGIVNQAGDIYISEVGVVETLVDTVMDDMINRDSTVAASDASELVAEIDESTEVLATADVLEFNAELASDGEGSKAAGSKKKSQVSEKDDEESSEKSREKLIARLGPEYFTKLRKTHIDQLIPNCEHANSCGDRQAIKEFLGKLLVDGGL